MPIGSQRLGYILVLKACRNMRAINHDDNDDGNRLVLTRCYLLVTEWHRGLCCIVYPMISRRRFQQLEVLEGQNILVTISGKKNKIRVYYLSWLKTKILKTDVVSLWLFA